MSLNNIKSFKDLGQRIEQLAQELQTDYMDAVMHYCQENNLEVDFVGEIIAKNPSLKEKIAVEAEDLNLIKKTARLPI